MHDEAYQYVVGGKLDNERSTLLVIWKLEFVHVCLKVAELHTMSTYFSSKIQLFWAFCFFPAIHIRNCLFFFAFIGETKGNLCYL